MIPILERMKQPAPILGDGAMGTMLFRKGLKSGDCPELINIERPEILSEIARSYIDAGSEIIQTNTFGGSPLKLAMYSLDKKTEEINQRAIQAARKAAGNRAYIAASCGPSGRLLLPFGDTSHDAMYDSFFRQLRSVISEGVDIICIETMTDLNEALIAAEAARSVSPDIPLFLTMTLDVTPKGFFTIMGNSVQQIASELSKKGINAIGSNCGNGISNMVAIAAEFKRQTDMPIIIQSNAGIPAMVDGIPFFPESPGFMADKGRELADIGVKIIGGCCGTTPEHISALKKTLCH